MLVIGPIDGSELQKLQQITGFSFLFKAGFKPYKDRAMDFGAGQTGFECRLKLIMS